MGAFVDQVRSGKIPQPTQLSFNTETWSTGYQDNPERDITDTRLFEAGLFFNEIFGRLRDGLAANKFRLLIARAV